MRSVNKVILIGNLGADPDLRYTATGTPVATLNVATNKTWLDKTTNEKHSSTEWSRVIVWNKQGENAAKYLKKGSPVYIEGELATRSWENKEGKKQYTTEIIAHEVNYLGQNEGDGRDRSHPADREPPPGQRQQQAVQGSNDAHGSDDPLSDIPF